MNRSYLAKTNKAALFFAMALLPSGLAYSQSKKDTVAKEKKIEEEDIDWFLNAVDNPHNGLTFCAGSLSANLQNDVPKLAQKFAHRTKFVHLRSTNVFENGDFIEAHHLGGRGKLIDVIRVFEKENPDLPMRIDHGRLLSEDIDKGYNPGYSFLGRMLALGQIEGVMATVRSEVQ